MATNVDRAQELLALGNFADSLQLLEQMEERGAHGSLLAGVAAHGLGDAVKARAYYEEAAGLGDEHGAVAELNLALLDMQAERMDLVLPRLLRLLEQYPSYHDARIYLAECYRHLGNVELALQQFEFLSQQCPDDLGIHCNYVQLLSSIRHFAHVALLKSRGDFNFPHIARALAGLGLYDAALAMFADPVTATFGPEVQVELLRSQAFFHFSRGEDRLALDYFERIAASGDRSPGFALNRSWSWLACGEYEKAWPDFRRRYLENHHSLHPYAWWNGEDLSGKTILLHTEQGMGDVIFSLRYLPLLAASARHVIFTTYPEILGLLEQERDSKPADEQDDAATEGLPEVDYQARLLDVPAILNLRPESKLAPVPYLFSNEQQCAYWRERLAGLNRLRVGMVWAGNRSFANDIHRSTRVQDWASLMHVPGIDWISLQKGPQLAALDPAPLGWNVCQFDAEINSFADTAALIANLDLVITVDTSVAHLAGAMGKEVWVLVASVEPDYRWPKLGDGSPWYPSCRVFRRQLEASWADLMRESVRPALASRVLEAGAGLDANVSRILQSLTLPGALALDALDPSLLCSLPLAESDTARLLAWEWKNSRTRDSFPEIATLFEGDDPLSFYLRVTDQALNAASAQTLLQSMERRSWPAEYYVLIARLLVDEKLLEQARDLIAEALLHFPRHAELHYQKGRMHWRRAEAEVAQACFEQALTLDERHVAAHNNLGYVLQRAGHISAAAREYQQAVVLDPQFSLAWINLALLAEQQGAEQLEIACWRKVQQMGDGKVAPEHLGIILFRQRRFREALAHFEAVLRLNANQADMLSNVAACWRELGDEEKAIDFWRRALALQPELKAPWTGVGWLLLARSDFSAGWDAYARGLPDKDYQLPLWDGSLLQGRRLLVIQDQGYGDVFQFAHLVKRIAGDVTLAVNHAAYGLMSIQGWSCKVIRVDDVEWGDYDCCIEQMRLPAMYQTPFDQVQTDYPYLVAESGRVRHWQEQLATDSSLKVGFVWSGSSRFKGNATRSTHLSDWAVIKKLNGVSFYSLQKDAASNQVYENPDIPLINLALQCDSFAETAAAMQALDLVISTCTAVAHLAAALGRPTWVLLTSENPDWRWLKDREDCPWYPKVRLFRQQKGESWAEVLERVMHRLTLEYPGVTWSATV